MTRSNRMKLRLIYWMVALIWYNTIRQVFEQLWCTELVTSTPQHYGHEQLFVVYLYALWQFLLIRKLGETVSNITQ